MGEKMYNKLYTRLTEDLTKKFGTQDILGTPNKSPKYSCEILSGIINLQAGFALANKTKPVNSIGSEMGKIVPILILQRFGDQAGNRWGKMDQPDSESKLQVGLGNDGKDILDYIKERIPHVEAKCAVLKVRSGEYRNYKITIPENHSPKVLQK
ncbi:hypothetical protein HHI36_018513 [Cryptolaemus montrouzieri]|uniref:Uncharacterized protein n=1 Tax=Cryptolaemus montrouzieri TaxID=559131 RepID=A0ABD2P0W0_9CUCU